ncbi:MAG: SRPBCC domain-containing protein [Actinomycetota bacterium]|nr:SRPBCC domain-containing protein [Actinomycetota bacterium]
MRPEASRVLVARRVACEPAEAFERFTAEIGRWWRPNPLFAFSPGRTGTVALEPGIGGRLTETYPDGSHFVIGVVRLWQPPERLVVSWRLEGFPPGVETELSVSFERVAVGETRVCVEHFGWDALPPEHAARHGFPLPIFELRFAEWWQSMLAAHYPRTQPEPDRAERAP